MKNSSVNRKTIMKSMNVIYKIAFATLTLVFLVADKGQAVPYHGNAVLTCGCIDGENNFYPGPSNGAYCLQTYGGEPWCIN